MNRRDVNELIGDAKRTKGTCMKRMEEDDDLGKSIAYAQMLMVEITTKVMVCDYLGIDLTPLANLLEQTRDALNDVMGDDNFDI